MDTQILNLLELITDFPCRRTYSSQIRSVQTGSAVTENCKSVFGIQDAIGNISEYSLDGFLFLFSMV